MCQLWLLEGLASLAPDQGGCQLNGILQKSKNNLYWQSSTPNFLFGTGIHFKSQRFTNTFEHPIKVKIDSDTLCHSFVFGNVA